MRMAKEASNSHSWSGTPRGSDRLPARRRSRRCTAGTSRSARHARHAPHRGVSIASVASCGSRPGGPSRRAGAPAATGRAGTRRCGWSCSRLGPRPVRLAAVTGGDRGDQVSIAVHRLGRTESRPLWQLRRATSSRTPGAVAAAPRAGRLPAGRYPRRMLAMTTPARCGAILVEDDRHAPTVGGVDLSQVQSKQRQTADAGWSCQLAMGRHRGHRR
jgi:hypothetical protein